MLLTMYKDDDDDDDDGLHTILKTPGGTYYFFSVGGGGGHRKGELIERGKFFEMYIKMHALTNIPPSCFGGVGEGRI